MTGGVRADCRKVIPVGNGASDPELKEGKDRKYATFSLPVSNLKEKITVFELVRFGQVAESANKAVAKGKTVFVEGTLEVPAQGRARVLANTFRGL